MTDIPDTETIKGLLTAATPGPWAVSPTDDTTVICPARSVVANIDGDYNEPDLWPIMEANASLIALAPSLAARVIEQDARIARLTEALRLHQAWSDSEDAGPDYGAQTRDTHPDGERIWRQWWDGNLDLCARAQEATRAALEDWQ